MPLEFFETARNKLRALTGKNPVDTIGEGFEALADDVDKKMVSFWSGTLPERPAAGQPNRIYRVTTNGTLWLDTGTEWQQVWGPGGPTGIGARGGNLVEGEEAGGYVGLMKANGYVTFGGAWGEINLIVKQGGYEVTNNLIAGEAMPSGFPLRIPFSILMPPGAKIHWRLLAGVAPNVQCGVDGFRDNEE